MLRRPLQVYFRRAEVAKQKEKEEAKRKKKQQVKTARLSFAVDEEEEEDDKPGNESHMSLTPPHAATMR